MCFLHIFFRKGGILINNMFTVIQIAMLLVISVLRFVHAGRSYLQSSGISDRISANSTITSDRINNVAADNFNIGTSFSTERHDVASYANLFLYVIYACYGFG